MQKRNQLKKTLGKISSQFFVVSDWEHVNVLNVDGVEAYAKSLTYGRPPHIQAWFAKTFVRSLPLHESVGWVQVQTLEQAGSPIFKRMFGPELIPHVFHLVSASDLPDWARTACESNALWAWLPSFVRGISTEKGLSAIEKATREFAEDIRQLHSHWVDYFETLPVNDIRMSYLEVAGHVAAWDKRLERAKIMGDRSRGVVWERSHLLADGKMYYENPESPLYLVRLVTKEAYDYEGARQRQCVATYYGREDSTIFSVRSTEETVALATIEVRRTREGMYIVQCLGFGNSRVDDPAVTTLVQNWADANKISLARLRNDEDEDDCDECDEYEEAEEEDKEEEDGEEDGEDYMSPAYKQTDAF